MAKIASAFQLLVTFTSSTETCRNFPLTWGFSHRKELVAFAFGTEKINQNPKPYAAAAAVTTAANIRSQRILKRKIKIGFELLLWTAFSHVCVLCECPAVTMPTIQ